MSVTAPPTRPPQTQPATTNGSSRVATLAIVLFPARAFLALGWIRAGVEKMIDRDWWTGVQITQFITEHQDSMLPFMSPLSQTIGARAAAVLALTVLMAELAIGVCLITGRRLRPTLWTACGLNVIFVAFGAVTPSAFYLVLQMTLLLALAARRPHPGRARATTSVILWLAIAAALTPFVDTLHPHDVIEDPAIMLATLAALQAAATTVLFVERRK